MCILQIVTCIIGVIIYIIILPKGNIILMSKKQKQKGIVHVEKTACPKNFSILLEFKTFKI